MLTQLKSEAVQIRNFTESEAFEQLTPLDQMAWKVLLDMKRQEIAVAESMLNVGK